MMSPAGTSVNATNGVHASALLKVGGGNLESFGRR